MDSLLETAVTRLKKGKTVVLLDDVGQSAVAYLVCPAVTVNAEDISFMINEAGGMICAAVSENRIKELGLQRMAPKLELNSPDFTVSVESREGVTTGISAADRARTLRTLARTTDAKRDLVTPGHIFPVRAKNGGVLVRSSVAEAAVDLMTMAGGAKTAVFAHCLDQEGELLGEDGSRELANHHELPLVPMSEIIRHRLDNELLIELIADAKLPIKDLDNFRAFCFRSKTDGAEHFALTKGIEAPFKAQKEPVLVRVQAEQRFSDILGLDQKPSRKLAFASLRAISEAGVGAFVYIRQPARRMARRNSQRLGAGASQMREFGIGAQILSFLGINTIRLLSNSGRDHSGVNAFHLEIVEEVPFGSKQEGAKAEGARNEAR